LTVPLSIWYNLTIITGADYYTLNKCIIDISFLFHVSGTFLIGRRESMEKFSIGLGFTSTCNMNCPFCYSKNKRSSNDDCGLDSWVKFIDANYLCIKDINYGTSENATSSNWYNFIVRIRDSYSHIRQAVTTNGSLGFVASESIEKKKIITRCVDEVDVSIDFGDANMHNKYRGNPNAFEWALKTLDFCNETGKAATIVMLGIDETINESNLNMIFALAKKYNAVVRMNLYRPVESTSKIKPVSLAKIDWLFMWIEKNHRFLSVSDSLFSCLYFNGYQRNDPSGVSSLRIIPNGDIFPSTYLLSEELKMGNISNFLLDQITENPVYKRIRQLNIPEDCVGCSYSAMCRGGVLDRRYLWYGSFAMRDPYCPYRDENSAIVNNFGKCHISNSDFCSVHDGYLPTLFFGV